MRSKKVGKEVKSVSYNSSSEGFYLILYDLIKKGWNPAKISLSCNLSKQAVQYHLNKLKAKGLVQKVGYGTWEIIEKTAKEVKNIPVVTKTYGVGGMLGEVKSDSVRGHAFGFKLWLSKDIRNWGRREVFLKRKGIDFGVAGFGQMLFFEGRKVWLCDRSIIVYEKASYWSDTAEGGRSYAISDFLDLVGQLERFLGVDFSQGGKHLFKVFRQHYSLVKNGLAIQYNRKKKKLNLTDENGWWGCIDDSYGLKEFETFHHKTADTDNRKVQNYFNGIKKFEDYTPEFVVNSLGNIAETFPLMAEYNKNLKLHIKVQEEQLKTQKETQKLLKKIGGKL